MKLHILRDINSATTANLQYIQFQYDKSSFTAHSVKFLSYDTLFIEVIELSQHVPHINKIL